MVIYNVTVGIDRELEQEWIGWMKKNHIPKVMDCGIFLKYAIYRILSQEEEETVSYSIQYYAKSIEDVSRYLQTFAPALVEEHRVRYKDRHVAFRSLLELIS